MSDIYTDTVYTLSFCAVDSFMHVYYTCVFTSLKIRRFNVDILNETLRSSCHSWLTDSYISRVQNSAKTCYQNLIVYFKVDDCNANQFRV